MPTQLVRLQLLDGAADGLRVGAIAGRTTVVAVVPFQELPRLLERPEANRVAVYAIVGQSFPEIPMGSDDDAPSTTPRDANVVYIGQSGSLRQRFAAHHKLASADWSSLLVASTTCGVLNSAHALRAERLLTERTVAAAIEASTKPKPFIWTRVTPPLRPHSLKTLCSWRKR